MLPPQRLPEPRRQRHPQPQRRGAARASSTGREKDCPNSTPITKSSASAATSSRYWRSPWPSECTSNRHTPRFAFFAREASRKDNSGSLRPSFVPCTISTCRPASCFTGSGGAATSSSGSQGAIARTELTASFPAARNAARPPMPTPARQTGTSP